MLIHKHLLSISLPGTHIPFGPCIITPLHHTFQDIAAFLNGFYRIHTVPLILFLVISFFQTRILLVLTWTYDQRGIISVLIAYISTRFSTHVYTF